MTRKHDRKSWRRSWRLFNQTIYIYRLIVESSFHIYFLTRSSTRYQCRDSTRILDINLMTRLDIDLEPSQNLSFQLDSSSNRKWYQISRFTIFESITSLYLKDLRATKKTISRFFIIIFLLFALSCCIINKIHCKMFDSDKIYKLSRSSIEKESNFSIIHSSTFSNLHSNDFASQDSRNINQIFVEKKRTLQEAINRIHCNTSLLILRENNQYVEWSSDINAQFQQWWLQMFVDESVINKTQRKIGNSLWAKKIEVNKQFNIWNQFIQMISTLKEYSKISCKNCFKILDHSTAIDESSTINMIKHLKTNACMKRKQLNSLSQLEIDFSRVSSIW